MVHWRIGVLVATAWLAQPSSMAMTLPDLLQGVLANHPSLRAQQALGEAAQASVEAARWQFYPTPSIGFEQADASSGDPNFPAYGDKSVTTLRLQQPLWTAGRLSAGLSKAQASALATQATQEGVRQDLALRVVQVYADWHGAEGKRQALEKSRQLHQGLQAQIVRRIANGVSAQSDLTLVQGRMQQLDADLSAARAQAQSALGRLGQLLGRTVLEQELADPAPGALPIAEQAQELLSQAQSQSPGVVRLQAQAQVAEAEVSERRADLYPEAYVRAERQYGHFSAPNSPAFTRLFLGFSSRFGAGLSSSAQVSGAVARHAAALADIESTRVALGEQIQADHALALAGQARLKALQQSLAASEAIAKAWNRQFVAGRKTWLDVMNAARELTQLETQIADARSSTLLLSWRLAIVGQGLQAALNLAQTRLAEQSALPTEPEADLMGPFAALPLYPATADEALDLRMAPALDALRLGVHLGADLGRPQDAPQGATQGEALW